MMGWRDDWRDDCRAPTFTEYAVGKATLGDLYKHSALPRTYADLYPPQYQVLERGEYTPHPEPSHTEWADGYRRWQAQRLPAVQGHPYPYDPATRMCFADNEI
jgi:hypothetical protein